MNKAIITVVGKDTIGIIASVCQYLASKHINITCCVNKLSWLQAADLRNHHGQECVGSDIERDTEEHVCATLIQLA